MSSTLSVDSTSAVPVYRQIVGQIRFLAESGGLRPGERLPPVRQLADNLGVNRNTVVKAYATLRELGVIETRGASGTVIATPPPVPAPQAPTLRDAVLAALHGGMTPEQVRDAAYAIARQSTSEVRTVFVECNEERAQAFSKELSARLHVNVRPSLLTELDTVTADVDLVITTFFHLAAVRRWAQAGQRGTETVAIVVAPHIRTLMKVAELPASARVGVRYSTGHQSEQVRDWLASAASATVVIVPSGTPVPADLSMLVVPTEDPDLGEGAGPDTEVVEFGNVLDEGSVQMVATVLDEIRARRSV
jgi:GntR family transcriptional regulator